MKPVRKKRLQLISLIFFGFASAVALLLYAMQSEMNHYYSLETIAAKQVPVEQKGIRVGGMVEVGSLQREGDTLNVHFRITDFKHDSLTIHYTGILPDLFKENQGVIARGYLGADGHFYADQILAKHDENYMPPELQNDLKNSPHSYQSPSKS
ncbi:MAG: cytochrome c maturation protein CcmE [Cardiobacteriaceae bacterium]|nr:cytochrome c maturation protein CcmE [Cardiobacteriaceae bacterium]